jgi:hypothetical protein
MHAAQSTSFWSKPSRNTAEAALISQQATAMERRGIEMDGPE